MPRLVVLVGPIAAGKNTVADKLAELLTERGRTVVVADLDDVAAMVSPPGAAAAGLWSAAHEAHGALVGQWMRSAADVVIAVGPIHAPEEQEAFTRQLEPDAQVLWVVIDAPVSVTFARAQADAERGVSREHGFHHDAHSRFREQLPHVPADMTFDSTTTTASDIATAIAEALGAGRMLTG